jgi:aminoglycoside 6'-N-acetyltransferase I
MRVRAATAGDLEALTAMRVALWPDGTAEEHRADAEAILAGRPRSTLPLAIFVAEEGSALIGFVEVGLRSHAEGCDAARAVGYIEGWWVTPERRQAGAGRALISAAEEWARAQGCTEMASDTWIDHAEAIAAHRALGYEVVERSVSFRKPLG